VGGIADKACWTEPLVTRVKLAGSMGIVKRKAVATKGVQREWAARLKMSAGVAVVEREFEG
jgi:hypothetical protein